MAAVEKCKWKVNVSSLEVRKDLRSRSKVFLKADTIVESTGETHQYQKQQWIEIVTLSEPTVTGYVQARYLSRI